MKPLTGISTKRKASKKNSNPSSKRTERKMTKLYAKLDSNDLVVTYIPSHRPDDQAGLALDILYGPDGFNIHSLIPSAHRQTPDGLSVRGIEASKDFDMKLLPIPKIKHHLRQQLATYWRSLKKGYLSMDHHRYQAWKHLKFNKLDVEQDVFEVCLLHGKMFVCKDGDHCLMRFLEKKGYRAGHIYPCQKLADDLENEMGGVKITFLPHPLATQKFPVLYIHNIHVLYNNNATQRIDDTRKQSFKEEDIFLLEDLRVRRRTTLFCPAN